MEGGGKEPVLAAWCQLLLFTALVPASAALAAAVSASVSRQEQFPLTELPFAPLAHSRYAVIAFGCASCPKLTCGREGCGTEFCYHCKQIWHPNQTCDAARQERAQSLRLRTIRSSSISYSQESGAAGTGEGSVGLKQAL